MKDLLVYTADADAQAVMSEVLIRHQSLGIRAISCEVDRHTGRDSGMLATGPELVQFKKNEFRRVLLLWDHHGSGKEGQSCEKTQQELVFRLEKYTWTNNNMAIAILPELESWLWHSPDALLQHLQISEFDMASWQTEFTKRTAKDEDVASICREQPKEMFEYLVVKKERRKPRPSDFKAIARIASLDKWQQSPSFRMIVEGLKRWFPVIPR
ncbi:MAG: hypothetical protein HQL90_13655 [Magnetococcales bacterium]|nr:hypothetical protein [Magnetococcales bacterium]